MKCNYNIRNLDCAHCAQKMEDHLNKDKHLNNVKVNFNKLTLTLETDLKDNVLEYVNTKAHEVEDEVEIIDKEVNTNIKKEVLTDLLKLIIGITLTIVGSIYDNNLIIILAYIVLLTKIAIKAIKKLIMSHIIDEHLLITISTIGAYFIDAQSEGLMVIILYKIGEILEHIAVNNSRRSIKELMNIKPSYANLLSMDQTTKVDPSSVPVGSTIIIKKGEQVPLDGIVIKGTSLLDTSALTGESKLTEVTKGSEVLSGSINTGDILELKTTSIYEDSTVCRILNLVENATDRKAKTENFVSRVARIYTPIVIGAAIIATLTFPYLFDISIKDSLYRALSFLVISCPCAIAISVPLSYFSGIGRASKEGILIKGSDFLDNIRLINTIIFDKTGTITTGKITDFDLVILNKNYSKDEIVDYILQGENLSTHPLAISILNFFDKEIKKKEIKNFKEIAGKGLSYEIDNKKVLVGSAKLVNNKVKDNSIYLKVDDEIIAKLELTDSIKSNVKETLDKLTKLNISTMMFTGDNKEQAEKIAAKVNISKVHSELLPEDKYNLLESLLNDPNNKVAFIGDGINDAPSIRRADIGISMGNIGSSSAIEASDIVIVNDDLSKILDAINISKKTNKIIKENLIFAISIKILVLLLTAFGISSMWQAVFADTGVTLLAIINTTRILKK